MNYLIICNFAILYYTRTAPRIVLPTLLKGITFLIKMELKFKHYYVLLLFWHYESWAVTPKTAININRRKVVSSAILTVAIVYRW